MSYEVRQFTVTVTAGTPAASPTTTALSMPARIVRRVTAKVPPGPGGELGWRLASGGVQVWPWNAGAWFILDDDVIDWTPLDTVETGAWQLQGYNTGRFDHTVYLTFELDPPGADDASGLVEFIPAQLLATG